MPFSLLAFLPNIAGAENGAGFYFAIRRWRAPLSKHIVTITASTIALIATSFLFPDAGDVHCWIVIGPIALNISINRSFATVIARLS